MCSQGYSRQHTPSRVTQLQKRNINILDRVLNKNPGKHKMNVKALCDIYTTCMNLNDS